MIMIKGLGARIHTGPDQTKAKLLETLAKVSVVLPSASMMISLNETRVVSYAHLINALNSLPISATPFRE